MSKRTITVQSTFKEREVTKQQFVEQWNEHVKQIKGLSDTIQSFEELTQICNRVSELAGERFEALYLETL
jgi:hypothetical protein